MLPAKTGNVGQRGQPPVIETKRREGDAGPALLGLYMAKVLHVGFEIKTYPIPTSPSTNRLPNPMWRSSSSASFKGYHVVQLA
jgi:hypothetical protein